MEKELGRRAGDLDRDIVGASDCFVAQAASLSRPAGRSTSQIFLRSPGGRGACGEKSSDERPRPDEISRGREMIRDRDLVRLAWGITRGLQSVNTTFAGRSFQKSAIFFIFFGQGKREEVSDRRILSPVAATRVAGRPPGGLQSPMGSGERLGRERINLRPSNRLLRPLTSVLRPHFLLPTF